MLLLRAYHYNRLDGQRGTLYAESEARARRLLTDLWNTPSGSAYDGPGSHTRLPNVETRYPSDWEFDLMAGEEYSARTTTEGSES